MDDQLTKMICEKLNISKKKTAKYLSDIEIKSFILGVVTKSVDGIEPSKLKVMELTADKPENIFITKDNILVFIANGNDQAKINEIPLLVVKEDAAVATKKKKKKKKK